MGWDGRCFWVWSLQSVAGRLGHRMTQWAMIGFMKMIWERFTTLVWMGRLGKTSWVHVPTPHNGTRRDDIVIKGRFKELRWMSPHSTRRWKGLLRRLQHASLRDCVTQKREKHKNNFGWAWWMDLLLQFQISIFSCPPCSWSSVEADLVFQYTVLRERGMKTEQRRHQHSLPPSVVLKIIDPWLGNDAQIWESKRSTPSSSWDIVTRVSWRKKQSENYCGKEKWQIAFRIVTAKTIYVHYFREGLVMDRGKTIALSSIRSPRMEIPLYEFALSAFGVVKLQSWLGSNWVGRDAMLQPCPSFGRLNI